MELIIDLHTHSHFSRATSKNSTLSGLYQWGKIKGISVIGTGDFTHPKWFLEIQEKLEPAEPGLYKLKNDLADKIDQSLPNSIRDKKIRFILTAEISSIYKKGGKVRKVHSLIVAPDFATVTKINDKLSKIGNLKSDGRPILGLDSKELLSLVLGVNPKVIFIPAHIWTPWFSLFGSKSGFNSIKEAFDELAPEIRAIETGLSSDPFMNWRIEELKNITITSHSDAHSPEKLGREATVLDCNLDFIDIEEALKTNDQRVVGTIEFFPEEGKYHFDGHRACNIRFSPEQTRKHQGICPVCGKPLTVGVDYRVAELANHPLAYKPQNHKKVEYIIPLLEIIAQTEGMTTASKKVKEIYEQMIKTLSSEFDILRKVAIDKIQPNFPKVAQGVEKMRKGEVLVESGYDGVFGIIKIT
jgi:DNA helicase-2/ATP-dependent DNA helicase PcrA